MPMPVLTLFLAFLAPALLAAQSLDAGVTAYKAQRWGDAESVFRRAVAANGGDHAAHYWLGKALLAQDRAGESEGHFERAVALQPGSSEYHLWLGNAIGRQAQSASKLKQPFLARRVKQEFETAVRLDGNNVDAREGLFQFYLQAPGFMGGGVDKARAEQREIARRNAYRGHVLLATLEGNQKNDAGVERAFRAGMTQFPDSAAVVSSFSGWLVGKGRTPEAWQIIDGFVKRRPSDPLSLYMVGRASAVTGQQLERGEQAIKQYLALPAPPPGGALPLPTNAQWRLGQIYEHQGRKDLARSAYQQAVRLNPENRNAKDALRKLGG